MLDRLRSLSTSGLILALAALSLSGSLPEAHGAACTGSLNCKACQSCSNCAHCGKRGGTCGVCLHSPPPARSAARPNPPVRRRAETPVPPRVAGSRPMAPAPGAGSPNPAAKKPEPSLPSRPEVPGRTAFNFRDRSLIRQKFNGLDLREADFTGANLRGAELREANLERARFAGAYLCGADFTGCNLKDADFKGAWYDLTTRWPEGFDPKAAGAKSVE